MEKKYKVARRVYLSINQYIADNFVPCLKSLNFDKKTERAKRRFEDKRFWILRIEEYDSAQSPLNSFDFFYYINGRFSLTNGHFYIPDGKKPTEVQGDGLNLKKLYKKFRGAKSHALVLIPFLCDLDSFLSGNKKVFKEEISELYRNLFLKHLSENDKYRELQLNASS